MGGMLIAPARGDRACDQPSLGNLFPAAEKSDKDVRNGYAESPEYLCYPAFSSRVTERSRFCTISAVMSSSLIFLLLGRWYIKV